MRVVLGAGVAVVLAAVSVAAGPAAKQLPAEKTALAAIARQVAKGHITPTEASRYRAVVERTARLVRTQPKRRAVPLASQLAQAAAIAPRLTAPRALAVFTQLAINDDWFASHAPPPDQTDITDADGVVYRYFGGQGFEFHPLAEFGALNAAVASGDQGATAKLAEALLARGVPEAGGGTGWEYYFNFGGGRAPWISGFAQAVAAQSLARAAALDPTDATAFDAASRAAYRTIPGRLDMQTRFGPWIKLYSFNRAIVLNAQLQTSISLASYAKSTSDSQAAALAASMKEAAAGALPSFHSSYWSFYQLPGVPSPQSYQEYVIQLLQSLSPSDTRFAAAAEQFTLFEREAPAFKLASDPHPGTVTFWISKPATVEIATLGGERRLSVDGGWQTVSWRLPSRAGIFPVTVHATDWAGNATSISALPIVHVAAPPTTTKKKTVRATAAATPALPQLTVGAGLAQPAQASLSAQQGFTGAQMTLVWTPSATPDAGAIAALNRLPASTNLVLDLYASPLPADDAGRANLAAYAASVAQQVPSLRDLVLAPASAASSAGDYETALAAVYDAVKQAVPTVRVDGALDGTQAPKATLAALAAAYKTSGRQFPLMDALLFDPAPAAGKGLWTLANLSTLGSSLATDFSSTAQPGATLPLLVGGLSVEAATPADEASQAAAYVADVQAVACNPAVVALLFNRLVDGAAPDQQDGLFAADGTPKSSLQTVAQAVATAESDTRGCASAAPPATTTTTTTTPAPPQTPSPATPQNVADPSELVFPDSVSVSSPPTVRVGCTAACLYLVTMQRAGDGTPVLANRGAIAHAGTATVRLPEVPVAAGSYRFGVWIVAASNPGPVSITRSPVVEAS